MKKLVGTVFLHNKGKSLWYFVNGDRKSGFYIEIQLRGETEESCTALVDCKSRNETVMLAKTLLRHKVFPYNLEEIIDERNFRKV